MNIDGSELAAVAGSRVAAPGPRPAAPAVADRSEHRPDASTAGWLRDSEERFRLAFDHAPIGMALMGLRGPSAGRLLQVNEAMCELLGRDEHHLVGCRSGDLVHPDDLEATTALVDRLVSGAVTRWSGDTRYLHASGAWIWVHLSISVLRDENGDPSHTISHLEDITDHRTAVALLEEQFRELADNIEVGFTLEQVHPPEPRYVNAAYCQIFGFDVAGPRPSMADGVSRVHPDDRPLADAAVARLERREPVSAEVRIVRPDGEVRWVCLRLRTVGDKSGSTLRIAGLYEDVTERRLADAALRRSEERLSQLANSTVVGFYLRDATRMIYMNDGFRRIFDIDPAMTDLDLHAMTDLVHPDDLATYVAEAARLDDAVANSFEMRIIRRDGEVRWVRSTNDPVFDAAGRTVRIAGTVEDITARKLAEAATLAAQAEAERANAAKNELLSRMSHELRTPLNAVLGFAQLLQLDGLSGTQDQSVGHILRGGKHLLAMVDDLLDLTTIESRQLQSSLEPVRVDAMLIDLVALIQPAADARRVEICFPADQRGAAARSVRADPRRLKQVLLNLLSNAVKYNAPGGRIDIGVRLVGNTQLSIQVSDTGVGIAAEDLPRLFMPFERLGAQAAEVEGTGLGLALSERLTALMGAHLTVESQPGRGSTFTVTMPIAVAATAAHDRTTSPVASPLEGDAPCRVLYIHDSGANVDLVTGIVRRRAGWTIRHAPARPLAVQLAAAITPTVILLDLQVPDAGGLELLDALRSEAGTADIPVGVLGAAASPAQERRVLAAGAETYFAMPLEVRDVLNFLDAHTAAPG